MRHLVSLHRLLLTARSRCMIHSIVSACAVQSLLQRCPHEHNALVSAHADIRSLQWRIDAQSDTMCMINSQDRCSVGRLTRKDCLSVTWIMSLMMSKLMAPGMESLPTPSHCRHITKP